MRLHDPLGVHTNKILVHEIWFPPPPSPKKVSNPNGTTWTSVAQGTKGCAASGPCIHLRLSIIWSSFHPQRVAAIVHFYNIQMDIWAAISTKRAQNEERLYKSVENPPKLTLVLQGRGERDLWTKRCYGHLGVSEHLTWDLQTQRILGKFLRSSASEDPDIRRSCSRSPPHSAYGSSPSQQKNCCNL